MASINTRQGALGKRLAAHLLRRTTYRITPSRINDFALKTAEEAIEELFILPPYVHPEGPISVDDDTTAWLTAGPYENRPENSGVRRRSVAFWLYNEMFHDTSIRHKMMFFWHSIFITALDEDWRLFDLWRLFQYFAVGNIKTLSYKVTLDSKMSRYLNNNVNRKGSPNENYAREFLELFTILKGEQIGTDNYTNYTEHDIAEAARVFTGFRDSNFANKDPETGLATGIAQFNNHDVGNKKFSSAFNFQTIVGATSVDDMYRELDDFVSMIFNQPETARAFVRRLYRYFVSDRITDEIERDVIEPLSIQLQNDNYEVENTLKKLLTSVHFFDEDDSDNADEIIGGKIKSPLELYLSSVNLFNANNLGVLNDTPALYATVGRWIIINVFAPMGLPEYAPIVEGYPGFYKNPSYSKFWFDQSTIASRYKLGEALKNGKTINSNSNMPYKINLSQYFDTEFEHPEYSSHLVRQFLEITLPKMPDSQRFIYFLDKLEAGLGDINWLNEWTYFKETGDDSGINVTLGELFETVCSSPEFQTF